jgi:hypothetical protein
VTAVTKPPNKAGKKTFVRKSLVSPHRWRDLRDQADPIKRDLMDLMQKHGYAEDYIGRVIEIEMEAWKPESTQTVEDAPDGPPSPLKDYDEKGKPLWKPVKAKRGPKPKWSGKAAIGNNVIYVWHAIEVERRVAHRRKPRRNIGLERFLQERFFDGPERLVVMGNRIKSASYARRLHSAAEKLMRADQALKARWERITDCDVGCRLGIVQKTSRLRAILG